MNTTKKLPAFVLAAVLAGCGGGGREELSPTEAVSMLLDQSGECFAVAAGRVGPDRFNTAAADIASVPMDQVCLAWPAGIAIDCLAAYAALSRPYSDAGQCKVTPG